MAPEAAVIVLDNASQDFTLQRLRSWPGRNVKVVANPVNRGFAAAVNQGVREVPNDGTVLLLNPDTELATEIGPLAEACARSGLAAGQLFESEENTNGAADRNGRPQVGFTLRRFPTPWTLIFELLGVNRLWPSNPINRSYRYLDRDLSQPSLVEQPAGAFLMFREDVWSKLGGFDERFHPVWFEDVDFCQRAYSGGYRTEYIPGVRARHLGGHSVRALPGGSRATYWCDSLLKYSHKHFRRAEFRAVAGVVGLSAIPRLLLETFKERNVKSINVYLKIIAFASHCFFVPGRAGRPF